MARPTAAALRGARRSVAALAAPQGRSAPEPAGAEPALTAHRRALGLGRGAAARSRPEARAGQPCNHRYQRLQLYVPGLQPYTPGLQPYVPGLQPYVRGLQPYVPAPEACLLSTAQPLQSLYIRLQPLYIRLQPLPRLNIDLARISTRGISSGGDMAVQFQVSSRSPPAYVLRDVRT